jgi:hypothetical protein
VAAEEEIRMGKSFFLVAIAAGLMLAGTGCDDSGPEGCPIEECYRAIHCVEECGGPVIQSSCCACPAGSFDDIGCDSEGGG